MDSLRGQFLVATPGLRDRNFNRSVVLVLQHDDEGALGLIINRPTRQTIAELLEDEATPAQDDERVLHVGGPVRGPLMVLHDQLELADASIVPGVYFSAEPERVQQLAQEAQDEDGQTLFFLGYSGWAAGQLDDELKLGGWLTTPATAADVFDQWRDVWKELIDRIGGDILGHTIRQDLRPSDPTSN